MPMITTTISNSMRVKPVRVRGIAGSWTSEEGAAGVPQS